MGNFCVRQVVLQSILLFSNNVQHEILWHKVRGGMFLKEVVLCIEFTTRPQPSQTTTQIYTAYLPRDALRRKNPNRVM